MARRSSKNNRRGGGGGRSRILSKMVGDAKIGIIDEATSPSEKYVKNTLSVKPFSIFRKTNKKHNTNVLSRWLRGTARIHTMRSPSVKNSRRSSRSNSNRSSVSLNDISFTGVGPK